MDITKLIILASSSKGNCLLIKHKNFKILFDCGISCKKLELLLSQLDIFPNEIDFIFISHEHIDHIRGLKVFANKWNTKVALNNNTYLFLKHKSADPQNYFLIENNKLIDFNYFKIETISIPHDALDPLGFILYFEDKKIPIMTDFGYASDNILSMLKNSSSIFIESNYEEPLLKTIDRPWKIKQRIMSNYGHLSNQQCLQILEKINHDKLENIILGHISEDANSYNMVSDLQNNLNLSSKTDFFVVEKDQILEVEI